MPAHLSPHQGAPCPHPDSAAVPRWLRRCSVRCRRRVGPVGRAVERRAASRQGPDQGPDHRGPDPRPQRLPRRTSSRRPAPAGRTRHRPARRSSAVRSTSPPTSAALRATNPNTLFVSAGDLIGATPLTSALFHDEPIDRGVQPDGPRLQRRGQPRVRRGRRRAAAHAERRLPPGRRLPGRRRIRRRRASTSSPRTSRTRTAARRSSRPTRSRSSTGVKVGIIGMTTRGHADRSSRRPASRPSTSSTRPTPSTRWSPSCKEQGVETIVVLLHEGGTTSTAGNGAGAAPTDQRVRQPDWRSAADRRPRWTTRSTSSSPATRNWAVNCVHRRQDRHRRGRHTAGSSPTSTSRSAGPPRTSSGATVEQPRS